MATFAFIYLFLIAGGFTWVSVASWIDGERDGGIAIFLGVMMLVSVVELWFR